MIASKYPSPEFKNGKTLITLLNSPKPNHTLQQNINYMKCAFGQLPGSKKI